MGGDEVRCGTCRYARGRTTPAGEPELQCRRYAPRATMTPVIDEGVVETLARWPVVLPDGWCGEHEPRAAEGEGSNGR